MLNSWLCTKEYNEMFKPITHAEFLDTNIDIVVASLWENHLIFKKILDKYDRKSKLILQTGNNIPPSMVYDVQTKNLLSSAYPTYLHSNVHKVFYRQEFGSEFFKPKDTCNIKSVANFKNIMEDEFNIILELEKKMPDWEFKCYGSLNRDGNINDHENTMSEQINKFGFIFHVKKDAGYGHVVHTAFACGKPTIIDLKTSGVHWNGNFIRNTASFLYEKNNTIIDSNDGIDDIAYNLAHMADNYDTYKNNVIRKYKEVVDFDKEYQDIKIFIENLL
jgi:hypothetical protein